MEYVEGASLKDLIDRGLTVGEAVEIIRQVLAGTKFAHERGIIHRDLKPQNVLVDREGRARVADFGIARAGASEITQTGSVLGTAQYLSPEQAQGLETSATSDLYSIGVMLYEALTGRVPFEADSPVAVALKQVSEPPAPPVGAQPAGPAGARRGRPAGARQGPREPLPVGRRVHRRARRGRGRPLRRHGAGGGGRRDAPGDARARTTARGGSAAWVIALAVHRAAARRRRRVRADPPEQGERARGDRQPCRRPGRCSSARASRSRVSHGRELRARGHGHRAGPAGRERGRGGLDGDADGQPRAVGQGAAGRATSTLEEATSGSRTSSCWSRPSEQASRDVEPAR